MKYDAHMKRFKMFHDSVMRDYKEAPRDFAPIIENSLMAAYHRIMAILAKHGIHVIKHQRLPSRLRKHPLIGLISSASSLANLFERLEDMRPKHVYGKSEDGDTSTQAVQTLKKIIELCDGEER